MEMSQLKRLYTVWKGNNRFFCGGRLIFGPDVASLFLTMFLVAAPSIAFCLQAVVKIHKHEEIDSNHHNQILGFPVLIIAMLVTVADLCFLVMTSSRDPGIIPRNPRAPDSAAFDFTPRSMEWVSQATPNIRLPRTKDVNVNGFNVRVKFCDTCLFYRPPRASHCSVCNNCVQKFDHHCPWVGQCIGVRNYRSFFLFISSSTFLCIYVFTFSWLNILGERKNYENSIWRSMRGEIVSLILIIYTFLSVWFVGGLTAFHLYLLSTNQTTYENFRYRYDKKENPYNKSLFGNVKDVFFSKIPPSLNDFRAWVLQDAIRDSASPDGLLEIVGIKEKVDLEMGNTNEFDGIKPIPSILQNSDCTAIEDNYLQKGKLKDDSPYRLAFPGNQEPIEEEPVYTKQSCTKADGLTMDERIDEESRSHESPCHPDHGDGRFLWK
ncbi:probable protein S-acyltransferase 1 isoform X1 [Zingiber officinale]|uniref:probable protein S-acyltransferase 1 isoform X1 n=1 Tax=Zingiber officinale TaxID=94328 RepID=UPI001C4D9BB0|nr:probable protein S-acyltransferase 1 isoform X1 [Zingiber officinale]